MQKPQPKRGIDKLMNRYKTRNQDRAPNNDDIAYNTSLTNYFNQKDQQRLSKDLYNEQLSKLGFSAYPANGSELKSFDMSHSEQLMTIGDSVMRPAKNGI